MIVWSTTSIFAQHFQNHLPIHAQTQPRQMIQCPFAAPAATRLVSVDFSDQDDIGHAFCLHRVEDKGIDVGRAQIEAESTTLSQIVTSCKLRMKAKRTFGFLAHTFGIFSVKLKCLVKSNTKWNIWLKIWVSFSSLSYSDSRNIQEAINGWEPYRLK